MRYSNVGEVVHGPNRIPTWTTRVCYVESSKDTQMDEDQSLARMSEDSREHLDGRNQTEPPLLPCWSISGCSIHTDL
jgi:hypothetical protein